MMQPKALVIEDDRNISTIISEALKLAGFDVEPLMDGHQAVARLKEVIPLLVTLDMHLPEIAGPDILDIIRSDARLTGVRVVMVTGDLPQAEKIGALADYVMVKPISFVKMRELGKEVINSLTGV